MKRVCSIVWIPLILFLCARITHGQESGHGDAADAATTTTPSSSSSCYQNLDIISLNELHLSIRRRNESSIPWAVIAENAENEEQAERERARESHIPSTRRYVLCPNTTYTIGYPLDDDPHQEETLLYVYEGGSIPLFVINPNLEIWCGQDGKSTNNCVLEGGEHQIISSKVLMPPTLRERTYHVNPANFTLKGVTLRGATKRTVQIGELGQDRGIVFQDCIFEEQQDGDYVVFSQTIGLKIVDSREDVDGEEQLEGEQGEEGEDATGRRNVRRRRRNLQDPQDEPETTGASDVDIQITLSPEATLPPGEEGGEGDLGGGDQPTPLGVEDDPDSTLGEPDSPTSETEAAEQQEEEENQSVVVGPADTSEADGVDSSGPSPSPTQPHKQDDSDLSPNPEETDSPTPSPAQEQSGSNINATMSPTHSSEIPMNPLSALSELSSATSNLLQITFDGCIFRNNHVKVAVLCSSDAVELYLTNNVFWNNTIYSGPDEEHENASIGTVVMLNNDPLPALFMESNCFMYNTYTLSPILLEHRDLSQEGYDDLELTGKLNGNFVYEDRVLMVGDDYDDDSTVNSDTKKNSSSCPNQMLIVGPNQQDDLLSVGSSTLDQKLRRGEFACVDMDVHTECKSTIYTQDMMEDPTTNITTDFEGEEVDQATHVPSSFSPDEENDDPSHPESSLIPALISGSIFFGMVCLLWVAT